MKLSWGKPGSHYKILYSLFIVLLLWTEIIFADEHDHLVNYTVHAFLFLDCMCLRLISSIKKETRLSFG